MIRFPIVRIFAAAASLAFVFALACDREGQDAGHDGGEGAEDLAQPARGLGEPAPGGGLIKMILQPQEDSGAPVELLLEVKPPVASEAWVESFASEVDAGLRACTGSDEEPDVDAALFVSGGGIVGGKGESDRADCLVSELEGLALSALGEERRTLRVRAGDPTP